jgi:tetratricopeptide (TPR) repeat protein
MDPATVAHIPREQYIHNLGARLEEMEPDPTQAVEVGRSMLNDDMPELAEFVLERCGQTFGERAEVLMLRGMIQRHGHDWEAAEQSMRQALEAEDLPEARVELAGVLLERARGAKDPGGAAAGRRRREAEQELRLAIDREPNAVEGIALLARQARERGLAAVVETLEPLARAYPKAWAPWRVLGDAYAAENQYADAQRAYEMGLSRAKVDELLVPYLQTLAQLERRALLLSTIEEIDDLDERDAMLRWRVAQILCDLRRVGQAAGILRSLVDDEQAPPPLRQRAKEILGHLESPSDAGEVTEGT